MYVRRGQAYGASSRGRWRSLLIRFLWKWRCLDFTVLIPPDQFNLLLSRVQNVLAMLNEKCPPLITREALLQPHLTLLDLSQDLLQLFESFFEVLGGNMRFLRGHVKNYNRRSFLRGAMILNAPKPKVR